MDEATQRKLAAFSDRTQEIRGQADLPADSGGAGEAVEGDFLSRFAQQTQVLRDLMGADSSPANGSATAVEPRVTSDQGVSGSCQAPPPPSPRGVEATAEQSEAEAALVIQATNRGRADRAAASKQRGQVAAALKIQAARRDQVSHKQTRQETAEQAAKSNLLHAECAAGLHA